MKCLILIQELVRQQKIKVFKHLINNLYPGVVAHAFNTSTWEAEAGGSLSSRPVWSTELVPGHPRLHKEALSEKKQLTN